MDGRARWAIIASPIGILFLLVIAPDVASGTTWAVTLLVSILASGAAFSLR